MPHANLSIILIMVLLPPPLAPTSAIISPGFTATSKSSRTLTLLRVGYRNATWSNSISPLKLSSEEGERENIRTFRTFNSPYCNKYNRTNEKSQYSDNGLVINKLKIIHILDMYIMPSHKNVSVTVVARIPS